MKITIETDDNVLRLAARHAESIGTTVEKLIGGFLENIARREREEAVEEFARLSRDPQGDSRGWKFNREEIQRKIR
jgi:hypothetical protein